MKTAILVNLFLCCYGNRQVPFQGGEGGIHPKGSPLAEWWTTYISIGSPPVEGGTT